MESEQTLITRMSGQADTANGSRRHGRMLLLIVAIYCVALCYLSYHRPLSADPDYFPDEKWRIQLPLFVYEHGYLPTGYEEEVRIGLWGFSYANYPLLLTTVVGGILMKIAGLFTQNPDLLVFAARLVSIGAATVFAWFAMRIGERVFGDPYGWMFGTFAALLPQVMFCGLYFNNDIVALAGSAMIVYAWVLALERRWDVRNVVLLAFGVVVVSLSYYNAYPWILLSFVVYGSMWFLPDREWKLPQGSELRRCVRLTVLAIILVLVCIGPLFIRCAMLNHGDFLGLRTVEEFGNRYGAEGFSPETRQTPKALGMSLPEMLTTNHYLGQGNNWLEFTFKSFVGVFGPMSVFLPTVVYMVYAAIIGLGLVGFVADVVKTVRKREYRFRRGLFDTVLAFTALIVLVLALQYSYATDYQAQGRYVLPLLLALTYYVVGGWIFLLQRTCSSERTRYCCVGVFLGMVIAIVLIGFTVYYW